MPGPQASYAIELKTELNTASMDWNAAPSHDWLDELQEFRGRVLWQEGRRPAFRRDDGSFSDHDEHDLSAYHLIVRDQDTGAIVGSIRYSPLELLSRSRIVDLDSTTVTRILATYHCTAREVLEGARLMIDRAWQRHGLGTYLIVSGTALARLLGRRLIWGAAGIRERQERVFLRVGYHRASETVIEIPQYDDEVAILVCEPAHIPDDMTEIVDDLAALLRPFLVAGDEKKREGDDVRSRRSVPTAGKPGTARRGHLSSLLQT